MVASRTSKGTFLTYAFFTSPDKASVSWVKIHWIVIGFIFYFQLVQFFQDRVCMGLERGTTGMSSYFFIFYFLVKGQRPYTWHYLWQAMLECWSELTSACQLIHARWPMIKFSCEFIYLFTQIEAISLKDKVSNKENDQNFIICLLPCFHIYSVGWNTH